MTEKTFTCPGLSMPQPEGSPEEGYVACYRAGHKCETVTIPVSIDLENLAQGLINTLDSSGVQSFIFQLVSLRNSPKLDRELAEELGMPYGDEIESPWSDDNTTGPIAEYAPPQCDWWFDDRRCPDYAERGGELCTSHRKDRERYDAETERICADRAQGGEPSGQ